MNPIQNDRGVPELQFDMWNVALGAKLANLARRMLTRGLPGCYEIYDKYALKKALLGVMRSQLFHIGMHFFVIKVMPIGN